MSSGSEGPPEEAPRPALGRDARVDGRDGTPATSLPAGFVPELHGYAPGPVAPRGVLAVERRDLRLAALRALVLGAPFVVAGMAALGGDEVVALGLTLAGAFGPSALVHRGGLRHVANGGAVGLAALAVGAAAGAGAIAGWVQGRYLGAALLGGSAAGFAAVERAVGRLLDGQGALGAAAGGLVMGAVAAVVFSAAAVELRGALTEETLRVKAMAAVALTLGGFLGLQPLGFGPLVVALLFLLLLAAGVGAIDSWAGRLEGWLERRARRSGQELPP